jgi:hypothetical protein
VNLEDDEMLGKPRAFVHFLVFVAVLGAILAVGSRTLNWVIALLGLAFVITGSVAVLWTMWKERNSPQATFPSQIGFLPKAWQKWMLGESDDDKSPRI